MTVELSAPVGLRGRTQKVTSAAADQQKIIDLLVAIKVDEGGKKEVWTTPPLTGADGDCPQFLADAIWDFQLFWKKKGVFHVIDGVADPGKHTISQMNGLLSGEIPQTAPEGQLDATACWAACLAWMTRVMPGTTEKLQSAILAKSAGRFGASGTISKNDLMTVSLSGVLLNRKRIAAAKLERFIAARPFPMLIAFASGPMSGHANVMHFFKGDGNQVFAMEPWSPDPSIDPNYSLQNEAGQWVFERNDTGAPFKFSGAYVKRPQSYYTSRPLDGEFIVAFSAALPDPEAG